MSFVYNNTNKNPIAVIEDDQIKPLNETKRLVMMCFQCKGTRITIDRMTKSFSVCSFCGGTGKRQVIVEHYNGRAFRVSAGSYRGETDDN